MANSRRSREHVFGVTGSGGRFDGDAVAQGFELADVVAFFGCGVDEAVVVVGAEILEVGLGTGEDVPDHDGQRAPDHGEFGYILATDRGVPATKLVTDLPAQVRNSIIPLYASDGETVVGRFHIVPGKLTKVN